MHELAANPTLITADQLPRYTGFEEAIPYTAAHPVGRVVYYYPTLDIQNRISGAVVDAARFTDSKVTYDLWLPQGHGMYQRVENVDSYLVKAEADVLEFEQSLRFWDWQHQHEIDAEPRTGTAPEVVYSQAQETAATQPSTQKFIDSLAVLAYPFVFDCEWPEIMGYTELFNEADEFAKAHSFTGVWNRLKRRITPAMDGVDAEMDEIALALKGTRIRADSTLSARDLDFLNAWRVFISTESEPSERSLLKFVGMVADPRIARHYAQSTTVDVNSQTAAVDRATKLVERMVGRKGTALLTIDEAKEKKVSSPALYKQYLDARKIINAVAREALVDVTRENGGPMMVRDLITQLDRMGVFHNLPDGFAGKVDERGYYTIFDEPVEGTPVGDVRMNPRYVRGGTMYVYQSRAFGAQNWQTYKTKNAGVEKKKTKFANVSKAQENIEAYKRKWRQDLLGNDEDRQELACITEILYLTSQRIGSGSGSTAGQKTYGLTTILVKNVTFRGNACRIKYKGKKGADLEYLISPTDRYSREVIELMKRYVEEAGAPTAEVFQNTDREVNEYQRRRIGLPITSHGWRYIRGTAEMQKALEVQRAKLGKNPTEAQVNAAFKIASEQVGEVLGHTTKNDAGERKVTGSTAVKSYIEPNVSRAWFEEWGVRLPRNLEGL